jgi:hypothetical protein
MYNLSPAFVMAQINKLAKYGLISGSTSTNLPKGTLLVNPLATSNIDYGVYDLDLSAACTTGSDFAAGWTAKIACNLS